MSQLDLALAIGYNGQGNVSRIEKDEQWPDGERLDAIANALGCKVSEFFIYAEYATEEGLDAPQIASERIERYVADGAPSTLDQALRAVESELPAVDPRTEAVLAVQVFSAQVSKQNTDRLVSVLERIAESIEQLRE